VRELLPLEPGRVRVKQRDDWEIEYNVDGETLPQSEIFHLRWWSPNGYEAESPIVQARNAIGMAMALERYGAKFFANGGHVGLMVKYPNWLKEDQEDRARQSWETGYSGDNAFKATIVQGGAELERLSMTSQDAQYLELCKYYRTVIAGIFRMQLHLIADLERSTNNNIEHQSLEFVKFTLMPWLRRWEQAINSQLLTPAERQKYFAEFVVSSLERGDIKTRNEAFQLMRQNGVLSRDEWRDKENMNEMPLDAPDDLLEPGNMTAIGQGGQVLRPGNNNVTINANGKGSGDEVQIS
jgi:HK97 family phage portal protein